MTATVRVCDHPECDAEFYAKGFCVSHWRKERRRANPVPRSKYAPIIHGTSQGYQRHRYRGEKPCVPCRRAWRDEHRRRFRPHLKPDIATQPMTLLDALTTYQYWIEVDYLIDWVAEIHPEWSTNALKRALWRLIRAGQVEKRNLFDGTLSVRVVEE